jgi:hypothetical protein
VTDAALRYGHPQEKKEVRVADHKRTFLQIGVAGTAQGSGCIWTDHQGFGIAEREVAATRFEGEAFLRR